jgi:hypothetical protein
MMGRVILLIALVAALPSRPVVAQDSVPPPRLPFTAEENRDGARFVWFVYGRAGLSYEYMSAQEFPSSDEFIEVEPDSAHPGDVVWWSEYVAIFTGLETRTVMRAEGEITLGALVARYGKPRYYRRLTPNSTTT